ncbi:MAG TPA: hypothetical protein VMT89_00450 [Candidatus Acidoferrales bacterium]|nr:hypothetical protein [Candidatus Acidoferrales bacterium]
MAKRKARTQTVRGRSNRTSVDLSLIRWMARLTPTQRLDALQDHVNLAIAFPRAAKAD